MPQQALLDPFFVCEVEVPSDVMICGFQAVNGTLTCSIMEAMISPKLEGESL